MASIPNKKSKKWTSEGIRAYVFLMFEYLRISPSYALATKFSKERTPSAIQAKEIAELYGKSLNEKLTKKESQQLLKDFQEVQTTYSEIGDVVETDFANWWLLKGQDLYGYDTAKPRIHCLLNLEKGERFSNKHEGTISKHFSTTYLQEGSPATLVLTVPLGITRTKQLSLIAAMLKSIPNPMPIKSAKTKKPLTAQRLRSAPLMKGLGLLWGKAVNPKFQLWRLGASCKVSKKYQAFLDPVNSKRTESNVDARSTLAILTHRMLEKAQLTAEHAARGRFPCDEKCCLPIFDPEYVYKRLIKYKPSLKRNRSKK